MVVFKDPGAVPENWKPVVDEENLEAGTSTTCSYHLPPEGLSSTQPLDELERRTPIGYCTRCQNGKPPRCHHCSVCMKTFIFLFGYEMSYCQFAQAFLTCLYKCLFFNLQLAICFLYL